MNSCSMGVYGELARYPVYIQRYYRIIKNGVLLDNLTILF